MKIIWIRNINIQDANIRQNSWTVSPALIFQANMFAHALGRKINLQPEGLVYIHRDFTPNGILNFNFHPNQPRGLTNLSVKNEYDSKMNPQLQPTATSNVKVTIGLVFDDEVQLDTEEIQQHVDGMRISGGKIISHAKVKMQEDVYDIDDLRRVNKGGFILVDRKDLLENVPDKLDTIIDLFRTDTEKNEEDKWLAATSMGYMFCETPTKRDGIRNNENYDHVCVESMIGLVQYVPINQIQYIPIWKYTEHSQYVCVEANTH